MPWLVKEFCHRVREYMFEHFVKPSNVFLVIGNVAAIFDVPNKNIGISNVPTKKSQHAYENTK